MNQFRKTSLDSEIKLKNQIARKKEKSNQILNICPKSNGQEFEIESFTENKSNEVENDLDLEQSQKSNNDITQTEKKAKYKYKYSKEKYKRCCEICGKLFYSGKKAMEYHMNTHTGKKPFKCLDNSCEKMFESISKMHVHFRFCHTDWYHFECDICAARFKKKNALKIHISYHGDPKIPCDICGKLLRNK